MAAIGSGPRIRTGRILINSQAHPPRTVDQNKLVEQPGTAPGPARVQTVRAAFCLPLGAQSWFRSKLSGSSNRRFHQISLLSNWCGQGESNSRLNVGNVPRYHYAMSAYWWVTDGIEPPATKGLRLQRSDGTSHPYWRDPYWKREPELHRRPPAYEAGELLLLHPATGGKPRS